MKKVLAAMLCLCLFLLATACTGQTEVESASSRKTLRITYDSSLYGTGWMTAFSKVFSKSHPDISLKITADSQLTKHYTALLESGSNTPDLIFAARTDWQQDASSGRLSTLNGLFMGSGGNTSLLSRLNSGVASSCMQNGHYYVYPWGAQTAGLLYHADLFAQYDWQVPTTVPALETLCEKIGQAGLSPFAWDESHADDWTDAVTEWWAQYEGKASMRTFLAMKSPDVYSQQGRLEGLRVFEMLVPGHSYGTPLTMTESAAVKAFTSGQAAMMPIGYLSALVADTATETSDIQAMPLPAVNGAKEAALLAAYIPGIAVVPAGAAQPALARTFLADLSTDENLALFMTQTGHPTAFILTEKQKSELPDYLKSAASIWQGQTLYMLSSQPAYYRYLFDWPAYGSPVLQIFSGARTADTAFQENRKAAQQLWNRAES